MPTVQVLYFAALREERQIGEETVEFHPGETIGQLHHRLFRSTKVADLPVAFAIDQHRVPADRGLAAGQTVAFLPPLGGG